MSRFSLKTVHVILGTDWQRIMSCPLHSRSGIVEGSAQGLENLLRLVSKVQCTMCG